MALRLWLGFPKSLDISKAIDKKLGAEREVIGVDEVFLRRNPNNTGVGRIVTKSDGTTLDGRKTPYKKSKHAGSITAPATPEAKQWDGWGTCLKPANEPIVLARKPISEKTVAENVLKWGTGGINIDDCRIELNGDYKCKANGRPSLTGLGDNYDPSKANQPDTQGRFPANVILDEEAGRMLDEQQEGASRFFYCAKASKKERNMGLEDVEPTTVDDGRNKPIDNPFLRGKTLRQNTHPTVKPVKLMEYLITLVTPPNGIVLDPFLGSGTTALAALNLGRFFIGIELNEEYCEIARRRVASHTAQQELKFA